MLLTASHDTEAGVSPRRPAGYREPAIIRVCLKSTVHTASAELAHSLARQNKAELTEPSSYSESGWRARRKGQTERPRSANGR